MNLDELRGVQRAERQRDSLQHLRDTFYEDVAAYLEGLKEERQRAVDAADDPFASADVRQVTDEIETTKEIANAIYERRVGKVVKLASFAAADMETDREGMTAEERALFEDLVQRIRENRETVLATLDGTGGASDSSSTEAVDPAPTDGGAASRDDGATDSLSPETTSPETEPNQGTANARPTDAASADAELLSDALGAEASTHPDGDDETGGDETGGNGRHSSGTGGVEPDEDDPNRPVDEAAVVAGADVGDEESTPRTPSDPPVADEQLISTGGDPGRDSGDDHGRHERTTVRITTDVGTILGVDDMEYDLAREDVVTLPTTNAEPLIEREAAERFD